jgi:hypothetical protein
MHWAFLVKYLTLSFLAQKYCTKPLQCQGLIVQKPNENPYQKRLFQKKIVLTEFSRWY